MDWNRYFIMGVFVAGLVMGIAMDREDNWLDVIENSIFAIVAGAVWPLLLAYTTFKMMAGWIKPKAS